MTESEIRHWMAQALAEARKGIGRTTPNPPVGAVIVKEGREIARGWHRKAGLPHAEREALSSLLHQEAKGATIFVTLEPCSSTGRTGACCDALIEAGVARVIYGARDPNPAHGGQADEILRAAGIEVLAGVLEKECQEVIRGFTSVQTKERPWVIAKTAISLDGRITRPSGEGQWLSSEEARRGVQRLRGEVDAIITSGATLRADDPALTIRDPKVLGDRKQPRRVVFTKRDTDWSGYRMFQDKDRGQNLVFGNLPLYDNLRTLALDHGLSTVLVEAGGDLLGSLNDEGLIDEWVIYLTPLVTGGPAVGLGGKGAVTLDDRLGLDDLTIERVGPDLRARGLVRREKPRVLER